MPKFMRAAKSAKSPLERFREVFSETPRPSGSVPVMPTHINMLASDELGDLISTYTAWREYTEDRHAEACSVFAQLQSEYDTCLNRELYTAQGGTVTERKVGAKVTPKVEQLSKGVNEAEIYKNLFASKLTSFSNVLAMLSRELTRRGIAQ
jgi:hypothetical protein